jgi:tetratricopeptide (TPR) repeat protein
MLAQAYVAKDQKPAAIAEYERYVKAGGRNPDTIQQTAKLLQEAGNPKEAAAVLERLNYIYPMVNAAHQSLGDLWIAENNAAGAVREYGAIVAHAPVDPAKAHYDLARAYHLNKQDEQAKDELLAALETAPGYRQAQKLLLELNESGTQHDTVKK